MPDSIAITIKAKTMEGLGVVDPQVTVSIVEVTPLTRVVATQPIQNFNTEAILKIDSPDGFPTWRVDVNFSRFDVVSGFIFMPSANRSPVYEVNVARLPDKWTPQFTLRDALPSPRFDPFKKILKVSNSVDLKQGPPVGDLFQNYDTLTNQAQILAKTALLNLYAVLTDEQDPIDSVPWFSHVRRIVRIDQERFIAEADPGLFENVQTILSKLNTTYSEQGYFTESAALHKENFPAHYDIDHKLLKPMITVKKTYEQGNVQLTLAVLSTDAGVVHLLDSDMDEHANIVKHGFDLIKHLVAGGTSPINMSDYIMEDSAGQAANRVANVDLGYRLV